MEWQPTYLAQLRVSGMAVACLLCQVLCHCYKIFHWDQMEKGCLYGDPAYPLRWYLQCPFRGAHLTQQQKEYNKSMSKVRVSVEWLFGNLIETFKFTDYKELEDWPYLCRKNVPCKCIVDKCTHLLVQK